jgi:ABC-type Na+ efflux pump permease subunit
VDENQVKRATTKGKEGGKAQNREEKTIFFFFSLSPPLVFFSRCPFHSISPQDD